MDRDINSIFKKKRISMDHIWILRGKREITQRLRYVFVYVELQNTTLRYDIIRWLRYSCSELKTMIEIEYLFQQGSADLNSK